MKIWLKKLKDFFKGVSKHPRFINVLSLIMYYYSRWVGKTTRWDIFGVNQLYQVWHQEKAIILVIWHGRAMMIPHFWNGQHPLNALVSLHKGGRIIAGFLEKYGFGTIGGSSNGGANSAALALLHSLQNDTAVAIIPDGPRGPRMKMSISPLYFARKSGKPIFGATYSVEHSLVAKSWDAMLLPPPFCRGVLHVTKPYYIPADASDEDLEKYRQEIEDEMNTLTFKADRRFGLPKIEPGAIAKSKKYPAKEEMKK